MARRHSKRIEAEWKYRLSGHESFPCRYAWLPKVVRGLLQHEDLFADQDQAMVELGLGKNMVRSARFWAQASGVISSGRSQDTISPFGHVLLGDQGLDPFLEDTRTLWLIHWNLSTDVYTPLLAWDYLLNHWQEPELVPSTVLKALQKEAEKQDEGLSPVTVEQHLDTFLHTYVSTRGRKGEPQEDNLDCLLVELDFIIRVGERELERSTGKREPIYAFRREEKPDITPELFAYCLNDFWQRRHPAEGTLTLREIAHGHGAPGQVFKLPEEDIRARLEGLAQTTGGLFSYVESANLQQVHKEGEGDSTSLLKAVYSTEGVHA